MSFARGAVQDGDEGQNEAALVRAARNAEARSDDQSALRLWRAVIRANPGNVAARRAVGIALAHLDRFEEV